MKKFICEQCGSEFEENEWAFDDDGYEYGYSYSARIYQLFTDVAFIRDSDIVPPKAAVQPNWAEAYGAEGAPPDNGVTGIFAYTKRALEVLKKAIGREVAWSAFEQIPDVIAFTALTLCDECWTELECKASEAELDIGHTLWMSKEPEANAGEAI